MSSRDVGDLLAATYATPGGALTVVVDPHAVGDLGPRGYGAVVLGTFRDLRDETVRLPEGRCIHPRTRTPEIGDVLEPSRDAFEAPPDTVPASIRGLVTRVCKLDGSLMLLLDAARAVEVPVAS